MRSRACPCLPETQAEHMVAYARLETSGQEFGWREIARIRRTRIASSRANQTAPRRERPGECCALGELGCSKPEGIAWPIVGEDARAAPVEARLNRNRGASKIRMFGRTVRPIPPVRGPFISSKRPPSALMNAARLRCRPVNVTTFERPGWRSKALSRRLVTPRPFDPRIERHHREAPRPALRKQRREQA